MRRPINAYFHPDGKHFTVMLKKMRDHIYRVRHQILNEPLNTGRKLHFLKRYLHWKLFGKHGTHNWSITFENGMRSLVHPYPDHDAGELNIWTRNVDWHDTQLVRRVVEPGDMIVDAGCNVGNRTWALADIIGGALMLDASTHALERVRENLALNHLAPQRFHLVRKAVGASKGIIHFTDIGGAHTLNRVVDAKDADTKHSTVQVEMTTIDHEVARLDMRPTYIKVDVEGQDLNALKGALRTLRSGCVRLVKFEHNPREPIQPLLDLFEGLQWTVFAQIDGKITLDAQYIAHAPNLFAAPPLVLQGLQGGT